MKIIRNLIIMVCFAVFMTSAIAQDEEAPSVYTYATYFYCDVTGQERADEIMKAQDAPVYDKLVEEGIMSGWGWLAHHTGGKWRRAQYHQAGSIEALLDAQEEMGKRLDASADEAMSKEFGSICNAHEDYIWKVEAGSAGDTRGKAGFSVYYQCEETKEDRADELFKKAFAPIFNKYVEAGKLTSWGWSSHWVGGKYRKLQTMTASNHKALLKARGELLNDMYGDDNDNAAGNEFTEICGSHSDYMWDIQMESS